jgi:hypothetical protein
MRALFDTNILIDYLAGREDAARELARHPDRLVSAITWMEVLIGARTEDEEAVIRMFLRDFGIVEVDRKVAWEAVILRRTHRLRMPDAVIWASARTESALFVTRNTRDFPADDPGIRVPY